VGLRVFAATVVNPIVLGISQTGAGFMVCSLSLSSPQVEAEHRSTDSLGHPCSIPNVIGDRLRRLALSLWLS